MFMQVMNYDFSHYTFVVSIAVDMGCSRALPLEDQVQSYSIIDDSLH